MTALILAKLAPWLIAAGAVIAGLLGWRRAIRRDVRQETALQVAEAATRKAQQDKVDLERMANVEILDADRSREFLLSRDPGTK